MATKEEILDYATQSPENTNRAVLSSMLNSISGGGDTEKFIVHFLHDEEYTADKTIEEIYEAAKTGKEVVGYSSFANESKEGVNILYLVSYYIRLNNNTKNVEFLYGGESILIGAATSSGDQWYLPS